MRAKRLPAVFVGHEIYRQAAYGTNHPLAIPRVAPVMDLCRALGWLGPGEFHASPRASERELAWFHTRDYVDALRRATEAGIVDIETRERYRLGTMENPLFPGVFERAATSVGGSIRAAELALEGRIAYHPAGGTHHGRPDRAAGFCYFNDPVFAILALLKGGLERILYVDLDAHHGDGVQDAFADDPRVWTISIHEQGRWPNTGALADVGGGRACNLPVPRGFADRELALLLDEVVLPLARGVDAAGGRPHVRRRRARRRPALRDGAHERRTVVGGRATRRPRAGGGGARRRRLQPVDGHAVLDRVCGDGCRGVRSPRRCRRRRERSLRGCTPT